MKHWREFFNFESNDQAETFKVEVDRAQILADLVHKITHEYDDKKEQLEHILNLPKTFNEFILVIHFFGVWQGVHQAQEEISEMIVSTAKINVVDVSGLREKLSHIVKKKTN